MVGGVKIYFCACGILKKEFKEKDFQTGSKIKTQLLVENKRICQSFLGKLKGMNKDILG